MPYRRPNTSLWWITVKGVRQSSGTPCLEDAKALEARLNHQEWLNEKMDIKPPRSWKEAVLKYLTERAHKASYETMRQRLAWWGEHLGGVHDITKISRDLIDTTLRANRPTTRLPSSANTTANKYAIVVGAVLNAACREWAWIESSPKVRRYPEPEHKRAYLRVGEWLALATELPEHLLAPATFALATGLRDAKVFGLEWKQIDPQLRTLTTVGNKQKRGVVIPLNDTAMAVLKQIRAGFTEHQKKTCKRVFLWRGKPLIDYGDAWYRALERSGLGERRNWIGEDAKPHTEWTGFTWHGLRHTFASWLGQNGASEMVIDQLCGWAEKDMRSTYTHLDTEHLRPHAATIDKVLERGTVHEVSLVATHSLHSGSGWD